MNNYKLVAVLFLICIFIISGCTSQSNTDNTESEKVTYNLKVSTDNTTDTELSATLAEGDHAGYANCDDCTDDISASSRDLTLEFTPQIKINMPVNDIYTENDIFNVTFTYRNGSAFTVEEFNYSIDGGANTSINKVSTYETTLAGITYTSHNITVCANSTVSGSLNCKTHDWTKLEWWNNSWQYRMQFNVRPNDRDWVNNQTLLQLTTSNFTYANGNDTCKDYRIVDTSNVTRDIYIQCNTSGQTTIFIETNATKDTNTTLFLYYGNDDATSVSNCIDTMHWCNNEGNTSLWSGEKADGRVGTYLIEQNSSIVKYGNYSTKLNITGNPGDTFFKLLDYDGDIVSNITEYIYEMNVYVESETGGRTEFYQMKTPYYYDGGQALHTSILGSGAQDHGWSWYDGSHNIVVDYWWEDQWNHQEMRVNASSDTIIMVYNGTVVCPETTNQNRTTNTGDVDLLGVYLEGATSWNVFYDDMIIRSYNNPEPTLYSFDAETNGDLESNT